MITELGYESVRADQDTGASIILEMLERLFFSDLVVADLTIPNGNVYYEIGIRHASRETGLRAGERRLGEAAVRREPDAPASPSRFPRVRSPTGPPRRSGRRSGRALRALAEGASPMYTHIPGFPDPKKVDPMRAQAIRAQLDAIVAFQAQVREARLVVATGRSRRRWRSRCATSIRRAGRSRRRWRSSSSRCYGTVSAGRTPSSTSMRSRSRSSELDVVQEQRSLAQSKIRRSRSRDRGARGADRTPGRQLGAAGPDRRPLQEARGRQPGAAATPCWHATTSIWRSSTTTAACGSISTTSTRRPTCRSSTASAVSRGTISAPRWPRRSPAWRASATRRTTGASRRCLTLAFFDQDVRARPRLREGGAAGRSGGLEAGHNDRHARARRRADPRRRYAQGARHDPRGAGVAAAVTGAARALRRRGGWTAAIAWILATRLGPGRPPHTLMSSRLASTWRGRRRTPSSSPSFEKPSKRRRSPKTRPVRDSISVIATW